MGEATAPGRRPENGSALLTGREREVVGLLAEGMTAVAMAHRLGVSRRTVEKHLENVYAKLGVRDRLAAVLMLYVTSERRPSV